MGVKKHAGGKGIYKVSEKIEANDVTGNAYASESVERKKVKFEIHGEELIEKIAQFIVKNRFTDLAEIFLQTYGLTNILGQTVFLFTYPWVAGLFGQQGGDYVELFGLNARDNTNRILHRVRELKSAG